MRKFLKKIMPVLTICVLIMGMSATVMAKENYKSGTLKCKHKKKTVTYHYSYQKGGKRLIVKGKGTLALEDIDILVGKKTKEIVIRPGFTGITKEYNYYMDTIEKVFIPKTVKKIGDYAFADMNIEEMNIGSHVKKVGTGIFSYCTKLKKVTWAYQSIPEETFVSCSKLKSVTLKKDITSVGAKALYQSGFQFFKTKQGEKVVIPKTVKKIGEEAFRETNITSINVHADIRDVGGWAFCDCENLKNVTWAYPEIPELTFRNCPKLGVVTLEKDITTIEDQAFEYSGFASFQTKTEGKVGIPKTVTGIGYRAFNDTNIESAVVGSHVKVMGDIVFGECRKLKTVTWGYPSIPEYTFWGCANLESIDIQSALEDIGERAFMGAGIRHIVLPDSVTKMDASAFADANKLISIQLPDGIKEIPAEAFKGMKSLEEVTFGANTESIGESAFQGCPLKKIELPQTVKSIGKKAFYKTKIETLTLPKNVQTIGAYAFAGNSELQSIEIPGDIVTFEMNSIANCPKLENVQLVGESSEYIDSGKGLVDKNGTLVFVPQGIRGTYTIASSVKAIDPEAFDGCANISAFAVEDNTNFSTNSGMLCSADHTRLIAVPQQLTGMVALPEGITSIDAAAVHGCQADKIEIPNSVQAIKICAFAECKNLQEITIPASVLQISEAAFLDCTNLKTVIIEEGVQKIWQQAFENCTNLKRVVLPKSLTKIHVSAFANTSNNLKLECKKGSYAEQYAKETVLSYIAD